MPGRYASKPDGLGVGSCTFPSFLQGDLVNLRTTRGASKGTASKDNNEFARRRRDALRHLLRAAARRKVLPWGTTKLAAFAADQEKAKGESPVTFIDLDEDLEGDDKFNPVVIE